MERIFQQQHTDNTSGKEKNDNQGVEVVQRGSPPLCFQDHFGDIAKMIVLFK
uniref:Uncharacterized protein n=1 Tax=Siphoviridae sp. ctDsE1 TaxID=2825390 RepID=A0A8S5TYJ5_9CAUD|nr:MAG TPA: hypothetical protein [Siphoviridae sp. ctDsE1]